MSWGFRGVLVTYVLLLRSAQRQCEQEPGRRHRDRSQRDRRKLEPCRTQRSEDLAALEKRKAALEQGKRRLERAIARAKKTPGTEDRE